MNKCPRCHQPGNYILPGFTVCLFCTAKEIILTKPVPKKLLDDVMKSDIVLEAERIIKERSKV